MADVNKEVRVAFNGDDNLSKVITDIGGSLDTFTTKVGAVTGPLADMAEAVLKTEGALAALAIGGLAASVVAAGNFDTVFREITTLFSASPEEVGKYKTALIDFASKSLTPVQEIGRATYEALSAGIDWTQSIEFMTKAEELNVAAKGHLQGTVTLLAGALNAYNLPVQKTGELNDILFKGVALGNITLQDFSGYLGDAIGIASGAQVPFGDLVTAISALTSYGVPAAQAVTSVKSAITAIVAPSQEAKKEAVNLGLAFDAETLASKGLHAVLGDVYKATGGNIDTMFKLFGRVEALNGVLLLGKDEAGKYAGAIDGMKTSAGSTKDAYEKMGLSFENVNTRLTNSIQTTLITIGTPLLDEYSALAGGLTGLFSAVKVEVNKGTFDPLFDLISNFGTKLAGDLKLIADAMPGAFEKIDWSKFVTSIENLGLSVKGLFQAVFGNVDITTPEGLATVIQKIVDGITALTNVTSGILTSWKPFLEGISKLVTDFSGMSTNAQSAAGYTLGIGQAIDKVLGLVTAFTGGIDLLAGAVGFLGITQLPAAVSAAGALTGALPLVTGAITAVAGAAGALVLGWGVDKVLAATLPGWKDNKDAIDANISSLIGADSGFDNLSSEEGPIVATGKALVGQKDIWLDLIDAIDALPESASTEVSASGTALTLEEINDIVEAFDNIDEEKAVEVTVTAPEEQDIKDIGDFIIETLPDGVTVITQVSVNEKKLENTAKKINEAVPESKEMTMLLAEGTIKKDLLNISEAADVVKTHIEWKAKLDIADAQANADIIVGITQAIGKAWESTGGLITDTFKVLNSLSGGAYFLALNIIQRESDLRIKLMEQQGLLVGAQAEYLKQRAAALARGDAIVKFDMAGIYPELEVIMWKIIERVQVQANAEGVNFLLGAT